jgi:uncharacterized membrane-anchored protein
MKRLFLVLFALLLACLGEAAVAQQNPVAGLPWQEGPVTVKLGTHATLNVPDGYAFLDAAGTRSLREVMHDPPSNGDQYTLAPKPIKWIALFSYQDTGYVKDDEKLDPDAILQSYRDGTIEANKQRRERGWDELNIIGWYAQPQYDAQIKSLTWSLLVENTGNHQRAVNYDTRLLGRHGVMGVTVVSAPDNLAAAITNFKSTLSGFQFAPGESYAEYRPGDRVAEYGLAALITGGALAVAAKKGLFTVIGTFLIAAWKFVLAGFVALSAWVKNLFKKKQSTQ